MSGWQIIFDAALLFLVWFTLAVLFCVVFGTSVHHADIEAGVYPGDGYDTEPLPYLPPREWTEATHAAISEAVALTQPGHVRAALFGITGGKA